MFILAMPVLVATILVTAVFAAITVGAFILCRRLGPNEASDDVKNAAMWGQRTIGTIHALILSLVFANLLGEHDDLRETIQAEALTIEHLYRGLSWIDTEEARATERQLTAYTRMVIDEEWPSLAEGRPLEAADRLVIEIRQSLSNLSWPDDGASVAAALMNDISDVETARDRRNFQAVEPGHTMFWVIIVVTFVCTALTFFVYRPTPLRCAILAMYAGINGLVFFGIVILAHPFDGAAAISPAALEIVYERTLTAQR